MPDEYISREAALKYIKSEQCKTCSDIGLCGNCAVLVAVKLLEKVPAADVAEVCFPAELHVGDRAWKKAMSILDKRYAEAKKLPFIREPMAWALYHTWKEFDDGKRCD